MTGGETMEIRNADLILVRGTGPISRAIENVEHSPYSHVAGVVKNNELIEAEGFRKTGYQALDYYAGHADVFRCDSLTIYDRKKIRELAEKEVGGQYDFVLLFIELIRYWAGVILPYKEPPKVRICSTLWAGIYRKAGIDLCPRIRYPSPGDIAQSKLLRKVGSI